MVNGKYLDNQINLLAGCKKKSKGGTLTLIFVVTNLYYNCYKLV